MVTPSKYWNYTFITSTFETEVCRIRCMESTPEGVGVFQQKPEQAEE